MSNTVFGWMKDGENKLDELAFQSDGTYIAGKGVGIWKAIDERTLELRAGSSPFTIKFNEEGTEGVLVQPVREPASKMILEKKVETDKEGGRQYCLENDEVYL